MSYKPFPDDPDGFIDKGETTNAGGQYFRDFANFGPPLKTAPPIPHVYWMLTSDCLRQAWSNIRYIPFVLCREYALRHPVTLIARIKRAIGKSELY